MFEDLIPSAPAQAPTPYAGLFDDLIPAGGAIGGTAGGVTAAPGRPDGLASPRSTAGTDPGSERLEAPDRNDQPAVSFSDSPTARNGTSPPRDLLDDPIPAAAVAGGGAAGGGLGALAPEYEPIPDPWLGLKDAKTGIPLVHESKPGRFIAEVAGEDDGGLFWKDPETGEIRRPGADELIRPEGGKFKVYEREENIRPWTLADMALVRAIVSGLTAARDVWAGNVAPHEAVPRAVDFAMLGFGGARTPVTTWRPRGQPAPTAVEPRAEGAPSSSSEAAVARSSDNSPAGASPANSPEPPPASLSAAAPEFSVSVLRMSDRALESARESLRDMFEAVQGERPKENKIIDLGVITPEGAVGLGSLLRRVGIDLDLSGFRHVVDIYAARHVFTEHGNIANEGPRGQVPIMADDWALIPTVLSSPDRIKVLGRTGIGREAIGYWKRVDGYVFYVEEVRTGRHTLAAVSMRKSMTGEPGAYEAPGRPDRLAPPRSTASTDPGSEDINGGDQKD